MFVILLAALWEERGVLVDERGLAALFMPPLRVDLRPHRLGLAAGWDGYLLCPRALREVLVCPDGGRPKFS